MEIKIDKKTLEKLMKKPEPVDPARVAEAERRFEWLVGFMICSFKFVHAMLGMMTKHPSMNVETMGVRVTSSGKFQLWYNPIWTMSLTDAQLTYVFYHEMTHLALHHCTRRKLTNADEEKHMANVAHDLAVNELIPVNDQCQPPKDEKGNLAGCFVSELKKQKDYADIEPRQTAEWYYDYLKAKQKQQGDGGKGDDKGQGQRFDDHDGWDEHELADEKVALKIKDIDQQNLWGNMSATEKELILAAQVKKVNWRNYIRTWFGNQAWRDRISTRKKPNRRTGMIHPGYKRSYVDRWLVTGDTSGSVGADLLAQYVGVLNQLVEIMPIDFAQCDAAVVQEPRPYDRRRDKVEFSGRGGTDFQPIMNMVDKYHYRGVMILTDGEASAPTRPKNARVLWVLPPNHNPPVEWGDRVQLQRYA
jgi:predicted metal-dependent peptidase